MGNLLNPTPKVLIIHSHPSDESLNANILMHFIEGLRSRNCEYMLRDLNKEEFNPVYTRKEVEQSFNGIVSKVCMKEQEYLLWADILVWIYPCWNFSMPAILKGYIDKVFMIPNFSFASDEQGVEYRGGLFQNKKAFIIQTLGGCIDPNRKEIGKFPFIHDLILCLRYTGIHKIQFKQFQNIYTYRDKNHPQIKIILENSYDLGASLVDLPYNLESSL